MCDACICPQCNKSTSLSEIQPYKISEDSKSKIQWMCFTCWPRLKDERWLIPSNLKAMQIRVWSSDELS